VISLEERGNKKNIRRSEFGAVVGGGESRIPLPLPQKPRILNKCVF